MSKKFPYTLLFLPTLVFRTLHIGKKIINFDLVWFVWFQKRMALWLFWRNSDRLLFHCSIWPQKAVELQVEFQTVWYIFDEQVECIWKSLDTNVEKVVESAKDTKKVKGNTTKEIAYSYTQDSNPQKAPPPKKNQKKPTTHLFYNYATF